MSIDIFPCSVFFLLSPTRLSTNLTIWITRRVSYKYQRRIQGVHPAHTPLKLEKIRFFGVKSWFFTRNTPIIFAPPSAWGHFFKCTPLTWNLGSAPEYILIYRNFQTLFLPLWTLGLIWTNCIYSNTFRVMILLLRVCVAHLLVCCVVWLLYHLFYRPVSCMPIVASVSGLSILDCPFCFLWSLFS